SQNLTASNSQEQLPVCRAPGLPLCEPEEEHEEASAEEVQSVRRVPPPKPAKTILCTCVCKDSADEAEEEQEEEEQSIAEPPTIEYEMQLEDIQHELQKSKTRVELIDKLLSLNTAECPVVDPCVDMQLELNKHTVHPDILQLQRNNYKLRHQLKQLELSCKAADITVHNVRHSLCRDLEAAQRLQRRLNEMDSFKRRLEHQQALCLQRYRFLDNDKYDWDECYAFLDKILDVAEKGHPKLVSRVEYKQAKHEAGESLNAAKAHIRKLLDFFNRMV
ncbi:hypothetical protein KR222_000772, partial [Zaprionus bogoriensis]